MSYATFIDRNSDYNFLYLASAISFIVWAPRLDQVHFLPAQLTMNRCKLSSYRPPFVSFSLSAQSSKKNQQTASTTLYTNILDHITTQNENSQFYIDKLNVVLHRATCE